MGPSPAVPDWTACATNDTSAPEEPFQKRPFRDGANMTASELEGIVAKKKGSVYRAGRTALVDAEGPGRLSSARR